MGLNCLVCGAKDIRDITHKDAETGFPCNGKLGRDDLVYWRHVVNDGVVHPWEEQPEVQPPTLTGLMNFLRTQIVDNGPFVLEPDYGFGNKPIFKYGDRNQYRLTQFPTPAELRELDKWNTPATDLNIPQPASHTFAYFVHYSYSNLLGGVLGEGNTSIFSVDRITSIDRVRSIEATICATHYDPRIHKVMLLNWKEFDK